MFKNPLYPTFRRIPARLMFADDPTNPPGGGNDEKGADGKTLAERGYPLDTPIANMTTEQAYAYQRAETKKQQGKADTAERDRKALEQKLVAGGIDPTKIDEWIAAQQAKKPAEQQALDAAREEGKKSVDLAPIQAQALTGLIRAETGLTAEEVATRLEFVNTAQFAAADGTLDLDKVARFAGTLGQGGQQQQNDQSQQTLTDPIGVGLGQIPPTQQGATSLSRARQAMKATLTSGKKA